MDRTPKKPKAQYIQIDPNDVEVKEILQDITKEIGKMDLKRDLDMELLKKYTQRAKDLLNKIEVCEKNLDNFLKKTSDLTTLDKEINKELQIYSNYVKEATQFIYEFRKWVTGQEIQFVIQFENEQGELQFAQVPIQELIPNLNLYVQKGTRVGLRKGKTRLQISNKQMQSIAKKYLLKDDSAKTLTDVTQLVTPIAKKAKGYGAGRIFETVMENVANDQLNQIILTQLERIPGLRAGDLSSELVRRLIEKGILSGDPEKGFEASLKTIGSTKFREHTEIQNVNQIKYDLFNIVAITYTSSDIQARLMKLFTDTTKGPAAAKNSLAKELGITINGSLSETLESLKSLKIKIT